MRVNQTKKYTLDRHGVNEFIPFQNERDQLGRIIRPNQSSFIPQRLRSRFPHHQSHTQIFNSMEQNDTKNLQKYSNQNDQNDADWQQCFKNTVIEKNLVKVLDKAFPVLQNQGNFLQLDPKQPVDKFVGRHIFFKWTNQKQSYEEKQQLRNEGSLLKNKSSEKISLTDRKIKFNNPPIGHYEVQQSITVKRIPSALIIGDKQAQKYNEKFYEKYSQQEINKARSKSLLYEPITPNPTKVENVVSRVNYKGYDQNKLKMMEKILMLSVQKDKKLSLNPQPLDIKFFNRFEEMVASQKCQLKRMKEEVNSWYQKRVEDLMVQQY